MTGIAAGSDEAIWQLAETYTPHIIRAIRASLPSMVRLKLDSQDLAQILWASILLGNSNLSRLKTPEQLIAFLSRAARNKVIDAIRHFKTEKNDVSRDRPLEELAANQFNATRLTRGNSSSRLCDQNPTPSGFAIVREQWDRVMSNATSRDRRILELRLMRYTFNDISREVQVDKRTARRVIQQLIAQLSQ
jgi:RNA polymerase sigma factor (sigma-70 family)